MSDSLFDFFDETIPEPYHLKDGQYEVRIVKVEDKTYGESRCVTIVMECENEPHAHYLRDRLWFPKEGDDKRRVDMFKRRVTNLCKAFNLEQGATFDDMVGATGLVEAVYTETEQTKENEDGEAITRTYKETKILSYLQAPF